jgi:hypothetical protein
MKQPLRRLRGDVHAIHADEELKMVTGDIARALADIDPQLETYGRSLAEADQRRAKAETEIDKDRAAWKDRELWEKAKREVSAILATYKAELSKAIPGAVIKFRGSLATGWKGPHKVDRETGAARRFNPHDFDCDAFVEIPSEMWKRELVDTGIVYDGKPWAKLGNILDWERTPILATTERAICNKLSLIDGYQQESGLPHFSMTVQTDQESLSKVLEGNTYPARSLSNAGASSVEDALPLGRVRDTSKAGSIMPETTEEI